MGEDDGERLRRVKASLEKAAEEIIPTASLDSLHFKFYDGFIVKGIRVDDVQPGRLLCSFAVPRRLLNSGNFLHGGATASLVDIVGTAALLTVGRTSGVSIEIGISYLQAAYAGEELEIEAKVLRCGKAIGVASVEIRKKKTGKLVAQGRHTKYLAVSSKL